MRILAFDTALRACSAAVLIVKGAERKLARAYEARERGHAEVLMPMIEQVMREAGSAYRDLDRIAVTIGPGTFTGTRIGIATARGLGLALAIPVIGETSLAVMAHGIQARSGSEDQPLAIAVDARRGQIYFQHFDAGSGTSGDPAVLSPDDAAAMLPQGTSLAAGSGAEALAQAARQLGRKLEAIVPDLQPDAAALAEMALGRTPGREPVRPLYLRPPDAKPQAMSAIAMQQ